MSDATKTFETFPQSPQIIIKANIPEYPKPERENCVDASAQPHSAGAIVPYC